MEPTAIEPLGDRAFLAHFPAKSSAAGWAAAVRAQGIFGVTDVVLAYQSVAVFADPNRADLPGLERFLRGVAAQRPEGSGRTHPAAGRLVEIPVLYDGVDLDWVASARRLDPAQVIALHAGVEYDVFAIGFVPGFPYAGYLPPALSGLPRRDAPRLNVPAGSVAIAGRQTGIYPTESPGGWHLLGRTPRCIADLNEGYFPIRAGDRLRFRPITAEEFEAQLHERLPDPD